MKRPPHRCAWCRAKLAKVAPLPIEGCDGWACKARCRELAEAKLRAGSSARRPRRRVA